MTHFVFVDANILLGMYDYTDDDLAKLQKFVDVVNAGSVVVCLTAQVIDEYERNREKKISDVLRELDGKFKAINSLPRICEGHEEVETILKASETLLAAKKKLLSNLRALAENKALSADKLTQQIIAASKTVPFGENAHARALVRQQIGNPPGKRDSLGDQLNWELLLENLDEGLSLYILSRDRDWESELSSGTLMPFLQKEWLEKKKAPATLINSLNKFLELLSLDVQVSEEGDKDADIELLVKSASFASTHTAIAKLEQYKTFNGQQLIKLMRALEHNSQVSSIASDQDVQAFYMRVIMSHAETLTPEAVAQTLQTLKVKVAKDAWI